MRWADRISKHLDRKALVQMLQALVCIPSPTGEEDAAQEEMIRMLRDLNGQVDAWRPDVGELKGLAHFPGARILKSRLNVVATFYGSAPGPTLVLNGHIDTVTAVRSGDGPILPSGGMWWTASSTGGGPAT